MQSTTIRIRSPHDRIDCTMIEAITPESVTDGVSTEELDENLYNTVSPGLSDELVDHGLSKLESRLVSAIRGYSSPPTTLSLSSLDNNHNERKQNLVKVHVGFDVTRKGERSLVIDGYKFTKSRDGVGDRVFWRCSRRECKATAVTVADRVEHIRALHSHQPPVAAEFFAENSVRSEQEVRFNDVTTYPRPRVRRRSQPNPCGRPQLQQVDSGVNSKETLTNSTQLAHGEPLSAKIFEQVSPSETMPNQPSNASVNGFAAKTLTALITHLVESNSGTGSLKTHTSSREPNEIEIMPKSPADQVIKPDYFETRQSTQYQCIIDYASDQSPPPARRAQMTTPHDESQPSASAGTSTLEQLAAIATSFANGTSTSGPTTFIGHCPRTSSMLVSNETPVLFSSQHRSSIELVATTSADRQCDSPQVKYLSTADMMTPDTVGFIGKNAQGQLVVLTGEQLSDMLRTQQLQQNHNSLVSTSPGNNSSTSVQNMNHSPIPVSHVTSSMVNGQHTSRESHVHSGELYSNTTGPSDPRVSGYRLPSIVQSSTDGQQNNTDSLLSRLNGLPNSLSCIASLTGKTSDSTIQPIVVTALQVQPSGSPVDPTPVTGSSESSAYYSSTRRHSMLTELSQPAIDLGSNTDCDSRLNHSHASAGTPPAVGKLPGPGLLIHWKKEKMRESVEEDIPSDVDNECTSYDAVYRYGEAHIGYSTRPRPMNERRKRQSSSVEVYDEGSLSKLPCGCEDAGQTGISSSNSCSQPVVNPYTSYASEMPTRPPHLQHCLMVSTAFDEEDALCNQVQDGILVKVLNTVQQLTAKLNADADPPEVIQNCRAIQACLDTIATIRRVRSASGSNYGSPKNHATDHQTVKPVTCSDNLSDSNLMSSRSHMSDVPTTSNGQNPFVRPIGSDSTHHMLPA